jgi:transposase InsO family protein
MVTPAAERKAVVHLMASHGMIERRACKAIGMCRMTLRYEMVRPDDAFCRFAALSPSGLWRLPNQRFPTCYGTEFTSNAILGWADKARGEWHYIAPGKPMHNGFIESFKPNPRPCIASAR